MSETNDINIINLIFHIFMRGNYEIVFKAKKLSYEKQCPILTYRKSKTLLSVYQIDEKTCLYHKPVSVQIKELLNIQQLQKTLQ